MSYQRNKRTWDVGGTPEKLVNYSPPSRDLQASLVFS